MPYSTYRPDQMGTAKLNAAGRIEAGSMQEIVLTYTCGTFGIDDTGSLKIGLRFATDMGTAQFTDPAAAGYTTAEASNGAPLQLRWEFKRNIRPWSRSLYIGVSGNYLSPGDTITIRFGDRRRGSPGIRMQTYCESAFEFRVFVDAIATYDYVPLPANPKIAIVPGEPVHWKAAAPTMVRVDEPLWLGIAGEDKWRNPAELTGRTFRIRPKTDFAGLPDTITAEPGARSIRVEGLSLTAPGEHVLEIEDVQSGTVFSTNPIRAEQEPVFIHAWADTHGQSNETLGTNTADEYFRFGRDLAFLDVIGHQGNDFQITDEFWSELNETTKAFDVSGKFVCIPGYEWSANTAVGGDRNIHYLHEGEKILRSSHAQVESLRTEGDDVWTADDLFAHLDPAKCVVAAHVGGRYADIITAHDPALEMAVEVHSSWGTFEWIVEDAFRQGYRVGIVANSDGHKGRPGACYPGASFFGSMGGLTCFLSSDISRPAVFDSMRRRRHYATTGARMLMDVAAEFDIPASEYDRDPAGGGTVTGSTTTALMGAIVKSDAPKTRFRAAISGTAPLERIDLFDGLHCLETIRPWDAGKNFRRVRVVYEGAATRGRSRALLWDGRISLEGNRISRTANVNNWNLDRGITAQSADTVEWSAVTTGNYGAIDLWLEAPATGRIKVETPFCDADVDLADWDGTEKRIDAGGLGRGLRIYALPETMSQTRFEFTRDLELSASAERRLYLRIQQEDGHRAWSSPIYIISA